MDEEERLFKEIFSPPSSLTEGGLRLVWTAWNLYNLLLVQLSSADSPLAAFYCFTLSESSSLSHHGTPLYVGIAYRDRETERDHSRERERQRERS